jgi:hypothetical protein
MHSVLVPFAPLPRMLAPIVAALLLAGLVLSFTAFSGPDIG